MTYDQQVPKGHYTATDYDHRERFVSYYNQKQTIINVSKKIPINSILEIGKGGGLLEFYLKSKGFNLKTFDVAADLKPDYVGDVTKIKEVVHENFDLICCYEILEHIRFEDVDATLKQLHGLTNKYLIVSIPQFRLYFSFWLKFSALRPLAAYLSVPFPMEHKFDGQHYWEIGKKGFPLNMVGNTLTKYFILEQEFADPLDTYHRFFVLRKK